MNLEGRVALVTGGASGLGRAISLALAANGATVAINYLASEDDALATVDRLIREGGSAKAYPADVSDWAKAETLIRTVEADLGPIDILVNNAGITRYSKDLTQTTQAEWELVLSVNLGGAFACTRAVVPSMSARGRGCVIFISSIAGTIGVGSSLAYIVSKAALVTMTRVLARDLGPGLRVNAVAPGSMPTRWYERYYPEEARPTMESMTPVEPVADAVLFLVTNESVTGQIVVVDRGESLDTNTSLPNV
jgi:3-oxoacyl-[acyl-carrier protein] reductase